MAGIASTQSIKIAFVTLFNVLLLFSPAWPQEKLAPKTFKSEEQAIGWVKARGSCKGSENSKACIVDIELPKTAPIIGSPISPGYDVVGKMSVMELPESPHLIIAINRTRRFALSPNAPEITIASTHSSWLEFVAGGTKAIYTAQMALYNFQGEVLMRASAPDPYGGEFLRENVELWANAFGIGWVWKNASE